MVTVSFPGIGLNLLINRVAFSIAGFDVYWYGVFIGIGLAAGMVFVMIAGKKFGVDTDRALDVIIVGAVCAIIGGRLYYVLTSLDEFPTFASIFDLRNGGMAIYGVLIAAFASGVLMCKWRKVNTLAMFDMAGVGFLFAQALGRWGNFFNQEAFGSNTDLPWGMTSSTVKVYLSSHAAKLAERGIIVDSTMPVHPTFLYESLWCLIGGLFLLLYIKRRNFDGEMFLMYCLWYGAGRAFIEGLRTDSLYIGSFRISQVVAVITALVAAIAIILIRSRQRKNPDFLPLYVNTDAWKQYCAELDEKKNSAKKKKADELESDVEIDDAVESTDDERVKKIVEAANEPVPDSDAEPAAEAPVKKTRSRAKKAKQEAETAVAEAVETVETAVETVEKDKE